MSIVPSMLLAAAPEAVLTVDSLPFGALAVTLALCVAALCAGSIRRRGTLARGTGQS